MLSRPIEELKSEYDVIVIGTGYGGGISASRLSRAGYNVCVLERGREFQAGDFPDTLDDAIREAQYLTNMGHIGSYTGLFDIRLYDDMSVVQGCGLGGTSLINANVALDLDSRVFEDPSWPKGMTDDLDFLHTCYDTARDMLKPNPLPDEFDDLKKYQAHKKSSEALKSTHDFAHAKFYKTPINVTFEDKVNHVGVEQRACIHCGDCVGGCNHTAKNTTAMNYVPDAVNHGAEVYCETEVKFVRQHEDGGWEVHFHTAHLGREVFDVPTRFIKAKKVILSAGTLGSTEIMLRSKANGLQLSNKVGKNFSGNGDILAFAYNNDQEINGIGAGDKRPEQIGLVGPCITSVIDCRGSDDLEDGFVLEEGSAPGALSPVLPLAFSAASKLTGLDTDKGIRDHLAETARTMLSLAGGSYKGAVDNTQTYLVMSHDGSDGEMLLKDDRLEIAWPGVGDRPRLPMYEDAMVEATAALGGTFIKNPLTTEWNNNNQVTVHPLGGCCMGEGASDGVVNHKGQVFTGEGNATYDGLYVTDGSVLPRSVGVNPLLTISAVSERMCHYIVKEDKGMDVPLDFTPPATPPIEPNGDATGIRFTEKMAGYFTLGDEDSYEEAYEKGKSARNGAFEFVLTVVSRDVDTMLSDPEHKASIFGTMVAPALSEKPLTASNGTFQLFVADPDNAKTSYMRYNMTLNAEDGESYHFEGHKVVRDDRGFDVWEDTTTLFITVTKSDGSVAGRGILKIAPSDFMKQVTTVRAFNGKSFKDHTAAVLKFGKFFSEKLYTTYLG